MFLSRWCIYRDVIILSWVVQAGEQFFGDMVILVRQEDDPDVAVSFSSKKAIGQHRVLHQGLVDILDSGIVRLPREIGYGQCWEPLDDVVDQYGGRHFLSALTVELILFTV